MAHKTNERGSTKLYLVSLTLAFAALAGCRQNAAFVDDGPPAPGGGSSPSTFTGIHEIRALSVESAPRRLLVDVFIGEQRVRRAIVREYPGNGETRIVAMLNVDRSIENAGTIVYRGEGFVLAVNVEADLGEGSRPVRLIVDRAGLEGEIDLVSEAAATLDSDLDSTLD